MSLGFALRVILGGLQWKIFPNVFPQLWWATFSLREMCPNTEFFLSRIFRYSDWIWRNAKYLSVFSPNAGKYGPEKTSYLGSFHAVLRSVLRLFSLGKLTNHLRKVKSNHFWIRNFKDITTIHLWPIIWCDQTQK